MITLVEFYYHCEKWDCNYEWSKVFKTYYEGKYHSMSCPSCIKKDCYEDNVAITKTIELEEGE